jgi:hypothetical protein
MQQSAKHYGLRKVENKGSFSCAILHVIDRFKNMNLERRKKYSTLNKKTA